MENITFTFKEFIIAIVCFMAGFALRQAFGALANLLRKDK